MSDYNGWSNYETWCVKLWIDNDEYLCNHWQPEVVRDAKDVYGLADTIEAFVTDPENGLIPDLGATLGADLLNAALSKVDWREIAENMLADFPPEEEEEG